jgi:hypothetical protein
MDTELLIVTVVKALVELAGFFLLGQGLIYLLTGKEREQNLAYQILCVLTGPVTSLTRRITPKAVVDRHIPLVAFLILFWIWVLVSWAKGQICSTVENRCESDASPAATVELSVVSYLRAGKRGFTELTFLRSRDE